MLKFLRKGSSGKAEQPAETKEDPALKLVEKVAITPERLHRFLAFNGLPYDELLLLSEKLKPQVIREGEYLFNTGDECEMDYLLLEGNLRLSAEDGATRELVGGTESASRVVSSLRPRKYTALAVTDCVYLALDPEVLGHLMPVSPAPVTTGEVDSVDYLVDEEEFASVSSAEAAELMASFHADLEANRFTLTSIPDVAIKIRKVMDDFEVPAKTVADIITTDPAIAAKISKAANSAYYRGVDPCNTVVDSVVRLGIATTRQLVLCYTMRDLFMAGAPELRKLVRASWDQTVYVGAIAAVLAKRSRRFSPEQGMLAGVLGNVGVLSIFNYLENYPDIYADPARTAAIVDELKAEVGGLVLEKWGFPEELVACAANCADWEYDPENAVRADLCDLVITATYHASIGRKFLPPIEEVPACSRLLGDELCPKFAIDFMKDAQEDIHQARALIEG